MFSAGRCAPSTITAGMCTEPRQKDRQESRRSALCGAVSAVQWLGGTASPITAELGATGLL